MKNTTKHLLALLLTTCSLLIEVNAQVAVNENGDAPDSSAMLDVSSTDRGLLIPRLNSMARKSIVSPANGLMVYDSTTNTFWYYKGAWQEIGGAFISRNGVTSSISNEDDFLFGADSLNYGIGIETKFFLDKETGAFRAGAVGDKNWDQDSLGTYSIAFGVDTKATASSSVAIGPGSTATNRFAISIGSFNEASGTNSNTFGHNNRASGGNSNAVGSVNIASGIFSSAFGTFSEASGITSIAVGYQTKAEGGSSTALGFLATASGFGSYALGFGSNAKGYFSTTLGRETNAYSFGEVATGIFNTEYTPTDTTDFASEDRLFVIGNGTNTNNRSDALRIYKNGNMELNGALTIDSVYTFPVVDGTLDQVLATNGMGNLSWVSLTDSDNQSIDVLNLNGSTLEISLEGDEEETQELDLSGIEDHLFQFETCAQTSIIEQAASSSSVLGFTGWQSWTSTVDGRLGKIIVGTDILDAGVATLYEGEGTTGNVTLLATVDMEENGTVANFSALNISLVTGEQYTIKVDETVGANFIWDCTTTDVYSGGISDEGSNKDYVFEVFIAENCTESSVLEQNSSGDWNANFENGTVTAAAFVGDGSGLTNTNTDNQTIDKFQLNGTTLSLSLENDGEVEQTVDLSSLSPIGTIQMWATETPPTGWLICNGSTFNTSTYSELNAILGSNTLPDFRGRFPLGQYSNSDSQNLSGLTRRNIGDQAGAETHTLTINEMPAHSHNITYGERSKGGSGNNVTDLDSSGKTETTSSTGGNQAHNNMPPFYTINFIIKAE